MPSPTPDPLPKTVIAAAIIIAILIIWLFARLWIGFNATNGYGLSPGG